MKWTGPETYEKWEGQKFVRLKYRSANKAGAMQLYDEIFRIQGDTIDAASQDTRLDKGKMFEYWKGVVFDKTIQPGGSHQEESQEKVTKRRACRRSVR